MIKYIIFIFLIYLLICEGIIKNKNWNLKLEFQNVQKEITSLTVEQEQQTQLINNLEKEHNKFVAEIKKLGRLIKQVEKHGDSSVLQKKQVKELSVTIVEKKKQVAAAKWKAQLINNSLKDAQDHLKSIEIINSSQ